MKLVVVYNCGSRDCNPVEQLCKEIGYDFLVTDNEAKLLEELTKGHVIALVISLDTAENKSALAQEFAKRIAKMLKPEDCDLRIMYSTENNCPLDWTYEPDPRSVTSFGNKPNFFPEDKDWMFTLREIREIKFWLGHARASSEVILELDADFKASLISESKSLLRAAFNDMSRIMVKALDQGFSGSSVLAIRAVDSEGIERAQRYLVKIFPEEDAAYDDYVKYKDDVKETLPKIHYPSYDPFRLYKGKARSIVVMELTEGPMGQPLTLREMIKSDNYKAEEVEQIVEKAISVLGEYWSTVVGSGSVDLIWEYLTKSFHNRNQSKEKILLGYDSSHKWFGGPSDQSTFEERLKRFLSGKYTPVVTQLKKCHGDLHTSNLVVDHYDGKMIPVFIDFSKTEKTKHCLSDLVTLEADVIIRCLGETDIRSFLHLIPFTNRQDNYVDLSQRREFTSTLFRKVLSILKVIRVSAVDSHKVGEKEYLTCALLQALKFLSFGDMLLDENDRAVAYVSFIIDKLQGMANTSG
jgi:hypothetical protein